MNVVKIEQLIAASLWISVLTSGTLTAVESFLTISSGPKVASDNVCTA